MGIQVLDIDINEAKRKSPQVLIALLQTIIDQQVKADTQTNQNKA